MKKKELKKALAAAEAAALANAHEAVVRGGQINALLEFVGKLGAANALSAAHGRLDAVRVQITAAAQAQGVTISPAGVQPPSPPGDRH